LAKTAMKEKQATASQHSTRCQAASSRAKEGGAAAGVSTLIEPA